MAGIEQVKLDVFEIPFVRMGPFSREDVIILSPHDERGRLVLTKLGLPLRVMCGISAVIVKQLELDIFVAGTILEILIDDPGLRAYCLWITSTVRPLPFGGF